MRPVKSGEISALEKPLPVVHVVDDDDALRKMMAMLLESVGVEAVTHPSAEAFLESYDPSRPACLVLDVRMRGMSGLELQRELAARGARIPTIVLTGHGDVPMAVEAMRMGAVDFIEKPFREQRLLHCIRQALAQDRRQRREQAERAEILVRLGLLTDREREVLDRITAGQADRQIAAELGMSLKAIAANRTRIMKKMQVRSTAELVRTVCTLRDPEQGA